MARSGIISPPPLRAVRPEYLPAYLSNGLLGARVGPIPFVEGLVIISGLTGLDPVDRVESFARGPYPFGGDVSINGRFLSRLPQHRRFVEQTYDFSCGELRSRFSFSVDGITAICEVLTFCSRSMPTLVAQEVRVTVNAECELGLVATLAVDGVPGRMLQRDVPPEGEDEPHCDGALLWETHGALSRCGAAYVTSFEGAEDVKRERVQHDSLASPSTTYKIKAQPGGRYAVRHITSLVCSSFHQEPDRQAIRLLNLGALRGFKRLREENRALWSELWCARPVIVGASARWQGLADAAFYYMHSSAHRSSLFSTAMFGLAYWPNYHYYRGHVMWDVETFAFPSIMIGAPETARAMLNFRLQRLPAAHLNAALHGRGGIQFPWESGTAHGDEVTPPHGQILGVEEHVNYSVALAFAGFYHATCDDQYLRQEAWPVLRGVAEWISTRVTETQRGFEIKDSLGLAEGRPAPVDNDAYVNMVAVRTLREAAEAANRLGYPYPQWTELADRLLIPRNTSGVIVNHDHFTAKEGGEAGSAPEALAGFFPAGYRTDSESMRKTIEFYLGRAEGYVGQPMMSAPLGVFAAWIGDRALAARLFEEGYGAFINDPYRETNETSNVKMPDKPRSAPLFANLGGFLSSLYFGLPRLRSSSDDLESWSEAPAVMPEGWEGIEVERIWLRGQPYSLEAAHGRRTRLVKQAA